MILHRGVDDCVLTMVNHPYTFGTLDMDRVSDIEDRIGFIVRRMSDKSYIDKQGLTPFPCLEETQLVELLWGEWMPR